MVDNGLHILVQKPWICLTISGLALRRLVANPLELAQHVVVVLSLDQRVALLLAGFTSLLWMEIRSEGGGD